MEIELYEADCDDMRISLCQAEGGYRLSIWDKESDQEVALDNSAINALVHVLMAEGNALLPQA
jgi:hypothetical protein